MDFREKRPVAPKFEITPKTDVFKMDRDVGYPARRQREKSTQLRPWECLLLAWLIG
jgi:hypothetical protein